jgi:hypothetical protein
MWGTVVFNRDASHHVSGLSLFFGASARNIMFEKTN